MTGVNGRVFEFNGVRVDAAKFKIWQDDREIALEPKTLRLLIYLLQNCDRLIKKEEILNAIWGDVFVTENAMAREIAKLRKALGDDPKEPRYIETVHTKGYRFVAQVTETTVTPPEIGDAPGKRHYAYLALVVIAVVFVTGAIGYWVVPRRVATVSSIAVLPLEQLGGDPEAEYLADGMTQAFISELARVPGLNVRPRSAVVRFKGSQLPAQKVGDELKVGCVLSGHLSLSDGDKLSLYVELIDVGSNQILWSHQYSRNRSEMLGLQMEVPLQISRKLIGATPKPTRGSTTTDARAYEHYLKGQHYLHKRTAENLDRAIAEFKQASSIDPNYAVALTGLGDAYLLSHYYANIATNDQLALAQAALQRALQIDGELGEAHATLAAVYDELWLWPDAELEFARALELAPNYAPLRLRYANHLQATGEMERSVAQAMRAYELDPVTYSGLLGEIYFEQKRYDKAIEHQRKAIELTPDSFLPYNGLGIVYTELGRHEEAIREFARSVELSGRSNNTLSALGHALALAGRREEALVIRSELEERYAQRKVSGYYIAAIDTGLGDKDRAFEWLNRDLEARRGELLRLKSSHRFAILRDDPRYKDILLRMNLPH